MNSQESNAKIVTNKSEGFGYKYSNLADLAKAGIDIPPMKTQIVEGREFVFAKIGDEWIQGAQVIDVDMKGMNAAQAYGAALTYARRYTVQLVMAVACDDDDKLEAHSKEDRNRFTASKPVERTYDKAKSGISFDDIQDQAKIIDDLESLEELYKSLHVEKMTAKQQNVINRIINTRRKELEK